jgi:hypothetical protein
MNLSVTPNAPRFHALWQHTTRKRIFAIKREDWNALQVTPGTKNQLVKLNLEQISSLPLGSLVDEGDLLTSTAIDSGKKVIIKIYRNDPKDDPTPVNVDTYTVWIGLPSLQLNIPQMIVSASTAADENFSHYALDHVFLVKEKPGKDHWLKDLPSEVYVLLSGKLL